MLLEPRKESPSFQGGECVNSSEPGSKPEDEPVGRNDSLLLSEKYGQPKSIISRTRDSTTAVELDKQGHITDSYYESPEEEQHVQYGADGRMTSDVDVQKDSHGQEISYEHLQPNSDHFERYDRSGRLIESRDEEGDNTVTKRTFPDGSKMTRIDGPDGTRMTGSMPDGTKVEFSDVEGSSGQRLLSPMVQRSKRATEKMPLSIRKLIRMEIGNLIITIGTPAWKRMKVEAHVTAIPSSIHQRIFANLLS
jgi:hypothetical protein